MFGPNLSEWALTHRSFTLFLVVLSVIAGTMSYLNLGRAEDPEFTIKTMVVQINWPGASMQDTLKQITTRVEKKLEETPSLDTIRSVTIPGQAIVYVDLEDTTAPGKVPDIWYQVRKKLADIQSTFPSGTVGPFFNDEFGDTFGIIYAFTADPGFSDRELRDWAEKARDRLLRIKNVGKVTFIGTQDEKIFVEFSTKRIASLGLDANQVVNLIQEQNAIVPAGTIINDNDSTRLEVSGSFRNENDVRNINVPSKSGFVRLGDIAEVHRGYADPPDPQYRVNGKSAIGLAISMQSGGDILALGKKVDAAMASFQNALPIGIDVVHVADQPKVVKDAVWGFTRTLIEALVIVLAMSFLTLGLRAGVVVLVSIPVVLALTFLAMEIAGIALQRISLGALIIALTLLVDDAMITVEMMVSKLEQGMSREKAGAFAYTSTAFPMLSGTLVTVAGFIPVGYAASAAGEYTNSLFWVIAFSLLISWIVAVLLSPIVGVAVLPDMAMHESAETEGWMVRNFRGLLVASLHMRYFVVALAAALFVGAAFILPHLPQQFFPSSDRPELLVTLEMPDRSSQIATSRIVDRVAEMLEKEKGVESWSFYIGSGTIRFYLPLDILAPAPYRAQAVLVTADISQRERIGRELQAALDSEFPDLIVRVVPLELGPPVGWPIKYRVSGDDIGAVRDLAWKVADAISAVTGVKDANLDWGTPARKIIIEVDQDRARLVGVSSLQLSRILLAITSGVTITQVRDSTYLIDVVGRAIAAQRANIDTLRTLQIPVGGGQTVPLISIAKIEYGISEPVVWNRNRQPTITVQADVSGDLTAAAAVDRAKAGIEALAKAYPNFTIEVGGSVEASDKGLKSIIKVVPAMIIIVLIVLLAQLQSIQRLLIVLSVVPLGLIGVVGALLVSGAAIGFVAVLGIISLIGMIARNSVILVDQIEQHRRHGEDDWHSLIEATISRARPIILTAGAAILGMVPIAREVFWAPLAFAIIGGLTISTILTLIFLPALYAVWFGINPPDNGRQEIVDDEVDLPAQKSEAPVV